LSIVDNRTFKRLFYQVLTQDPTQDDIRAFFQRFQAALQARRLPVRGITTDGSPLYPATILAVFGPVPHQICEFHMLKDLNHAILRAVAQARKQLAAQQPKLGRGRRRKPTNWRANASTFNRKSPICLNTGICLCNAT
jgi:hypothetical protein